MLTKKLKVTSSSFTVALMIGLGLSSAPNTGYADDTEIFFGEAKTANLMFVLDESGSMSFKDKDADADTLIVKSWYQSKKGTREDARSRLPTLPYEDTTSKARFPTLQVYMRPCRYYGGGDVMKGTKIITGLTTYHTIPKTT